MDSHQIAWAAGFFDGEGTVYCQVRTGKLRRWRPSIKLTVGQTDPFPLLRFREVMGDRGRVYGPYDPRGISVKPRYQFEVNGLETVQAMIAMLWRWLTPAKREQAASALTKFHTESVRYDSPDLQEAPSWR